MKVCVQGKISRYIGGQWNGMRKVERRLGNKIIWPDNTSVARKIRVELPRPGTREYQYWVHALDAIQGRAAQDNYMRFTADGLHYYLEDSFDGTEPYKVEKDYLIACIVKRFCN